MAKMQVFTLGNLTSYDSLLKNYIDVADAKSLKAVTIVGNKVNFYRTEEPIEEGSIPAYTIELPETDISGLMSKLTGATVGNVVTVGADGEVADGGVALTDIATKVEVEAIDEKIASAEEKITTIEEAIETINSDENGILKNATDYVDEKVKELADGEVKTNTSAIETLTGDVTTDGSVAKAVKDSADAINATIGTVEEGKTVVGMIEDVIANGYDDEEVRELIQANADAIEAHKEAIDEVVTTLVGDDANKSVRTIANEELAKQLIPENAQESLNTLEEIALWIQEHPEDAASMNKAIEDLGTLVGAIPEGANSTTIADYVKEYADGLTSNYDAAGTAEAKVKELADGQVTTNTTAIEELSEIVGEGYEAIPDASITALFTV